MFNLYGLLFFLTPLLFFPKTAEVFEFNKIVLLYTVAILISAAWIISNKKSVRLKGSRTIFLAILIIFLVGQTISTIYSIDRHTSIFGYYSRFHGGLLSSISYSTLAIIYVLTFTRENTFKITKIALLSGVIVSIYATLEHFGVSPSCLIMKGELNVSCWAQDVQERVFATLGQPNWLAAYLVALMPLVWLKIKSKYYFTIGIVIYTALLFTKSRSGLIAFVISYFLFLFLKKKILFKFSLAIILATIIFGQFLINRPAPISNGNIVITESGNLRKIVWKGAFDLWKKYPVVGTGPETFAFSFYETRPVAMNTTSEWNFVYNKAHNEYLNFLATTGLIGFISYLILIIGSLYIIYLSKNIGLLAGYISILITNFFGFSVVPVALLFFMYPAMAISLANKNKPKLVNVKLNIKNIFILLITFLLLLSVYRYWLADFHFAKGDVQKAVELNPQEANYWANLGNVSETQRRAPENIKLAKININTLVDNEIYPQAIRLADKIEPLAPTDPTIPYTKALIYLRLGEKEKAIKNLNRAILLKPNYQKAQQLLYYLE